MELDELGLERLRRLRRLRRWAVPVWTLSILAILLSRFVATAAVGEQGVAVADKYVLPLLFFVALAAALVLATSRCPRCNGFCHAKPGSFNPFTRRCLRCQFEIEETPPRRVRDWDPRP